MQRRVAVGPAVVALVALVLAACTSGDAAEDDGHAVRPIEDSAPDPDDTGDDTPDADLDDTPDLDDAGEPPDDPEPDEPEDPFAVPDEIDDAYVDLVMNELLAIHTTTLQDVLSREPGGELANDEFERIRAVFSGPQMLLIGDNFVRYAMDPDSRDAFLGPHELGDLRWETRRIVESDAGCIVAIGYYDLTQVSVAPYEADEFSLVSLSTQEASTHDDGPNRTPWRIHDLKLVLDAEGEPVPEADWDRLNYRPILDRTCESEDDD